MSLTIKEIEHLAELSHLELTGEKSAKYHQEIAAILQYVNKIQELRFDNQSADENNQNAQPILREDRVVGISLAEQQDLISQAPGNDENLIKTKTVFNRS